MQDHGVIITAVLMVCLFFNLTGCTERDAVIYQQGYMDCQTNINKMLDEKFGLPKPKEGYKFSDTGVRLRVIRPDGSILKPGER